MRAVYNGVRYSNLIGRNDKGQDAIELEKLFRVVVDLMGMLTPIEVEQLFPIEKEYDGEEYGIKDYFYTREYLDGLDQDKQIHDEVETLIMEYQNIHINVFAANWMSAISAVHRFETGMTLAEQFANETGLTIYTKTTDLSGKEILINNETGEETKFEKPRPKHLQLV